MRIKLKKGYQRKLILEAKKSLTWRELSGLLKLNSLYLSNELKNEMRLISEKTYKRLCEITKLDYYSYIEEKLNDDWGRAKGGLNSTKIEKLLIKEKSESLAELVGIILGDGNIWVKKSYYYLTIVGDSEKDKDYLLNYVMPLFKKLFRKNMHSRKHKSSNALSVYIGSKDVIFTLKKFGLLEGNKQKNNVGIPEWIFESDDYLRACIRGLIDTDGSVVFIKGRNYPYIYFTSNIGRLRADFKKAMNQLKLDTSKWNIRENHGADCYIAKKAHIARFLKEISFSNLKHIKKLRLIS